MIWQAAEWFVMTDCRKAARLFLLLGSYSQRSAICPA
jgi:hypothetical protein